MTTSVAASGALEEIAEFFATGPSPAEVLSFRPSEQIQDRAEALLASLKDGTLSAEERRELDQFEHAERLMRLTKARIRAVQAGAVS